MTGVQPWLQQALKTKNFIPFFNLFYNTLGFIIGGEFSHDQRRFEDCILAHATMKKTFLGNRSRF